MTKPKLYIKRGCSWCDEAIAYLKNHRVEVESVVVSGNAEGMDEMKRISGQTKAPTLDWNGEVLADFGVEELEPFLRKRGAI